MLGDPEGDLLAAGHSGPQLHELLSRGAPEQQIQTDFKEAGASRGLSAWTLSHGIGSEDAAARRSAV